MSRIALVEPQSLTGQSLRDALQVEADVNLELFGTQEEDYGTLTEVGDEIALVRPLSRETLQGCDLAIVCGSGPVERRALATLPEEIPSIVVASDLDPLPGEPRLGGLGGDPSAHRLVSPHPVVIHLARLLEAVAEHDPIRLTGTILLPASIHSGEALDELFEQTRAILSFSDEGPSEIFGRQLAFNLLPVTAAQTIGQQVRQVLGADVEIGVALAQAGVFHSMTASLLLEVSSGADSEGITASLYMSPALEITDAATRLGPIDAAGRDEILVAPVQADTDRPDAVWLWSVMDNLAAGSVANTIELLRELLPSPADA